MKFTYITKAPKTLDFKAALELNKRSPNDYYFKLIHSKLHFIVAVNEPLVYTVNGYKLNIDLVNLFDNFDVSDLWGSMNISQIYNNLKLSLDFYINYDKKIDLKRNEYIIYNKIKNLKKAINLLKKEYSECLL